MKHLAIAALAASLLVATPVAAANLNPFAGQDNGVVVLPDGKSFPAALPAVTASNEDAILGQLDIKVELKDERITMLDGTIYAVARLIIVNQCGGTDPALANNEWFIYEGEPAVVVFCGHQFSE